MIRISIAALAVLAAVSCTAAQQPAVQTGPRPAPDTLLSMSRIQALPEPARTEWSRYVETSRENARRDRAAMDAELRAAGKDRWTPAPAGRGFSVTDAMTEAWFRGDSARQMANIIASYQTPTGGWSKRMEFIHPRQPGESFSADDNWTWIGTLDNGSTTEQLRFLAGAIAAHNDPAHAASFVRGIEYLLAAQQPTGCWPQVYPLMGGYHDAATFNDDATINALRVLRDAANGEFAWVPAEVRTRTQAALDRGIECIVRTQVVVNGRWTVWGAQHDPIGFGPVKARAYEHASLSGRESAAILNFLMEIRTPSQAVVNAIDGAAGWFREAAITN